MNKQTKLKCFKLELTLLVFKNDLPRFHVIKKIMSLNMNKYDIYNYKPK